MAFVVVTSSSSSFSSFFCFLSQLLRLLLLPLLFLSAQREIVCNFVAISSFTAAAAAAVAVAKLFLQYFLIKPGPVSQLVSSVSWTTALLLSFCCCSIKLRNVSSQVFSLSLSQAVVSVCDACTYTQPLVESAPKIHLPLFCPFSFLPFLFHTEESCSS